MTSALPPSYTTSHPPGLGPSTGEPENFGDQAMEFLKAAGEMALEFGKGCRDIVVQSFGDNESYLVKTFGKGSFIGKRVRGPCEKVFGKLRFFNEYLPEDKDPFHVWMVILSVSVLVLAVLSLSAERDDVTISPIKKIYIHPPSARRVMLPDGRFLAYKEQGVSAETARFSLIGPHTFLSSRLAGMPGLKSSLLEEFGIRLLTYDLPGFGESDPHPQRNLESSAMDMSFLANALGVNDRFWVIGYSTGSMHAWAALRYIPHKLAGAAMFAPMVNPYDPSMTKDERHWTWQKWSRKRKLLYFLARRFPTVLPLFYRRSFLSGKHDQIDKWLALSLGKRDRALVEDPIYEEFWQRDVEESIRQGIAKPFVEEATLLVSDWGFRLHDLRLQKLRVKSVIHWLKSLIGDVQEEFTGFLGPIHIWQGMDDMVVPPSMTDFVHRILPGAAVHKLPYEGHYTYIYFCDECHRQIFTTLFGSPEGQLNISRSVDQSSLDRDTEDLKVQTINDSATE